MKASHLWGFFMWNGRTIQFVTLAGRYAHLWLYPDLRLPLLLVHWAPNGGLLI